VTVLAANTPKHHQPADALAHLGPRVRLVTVDVDTRLKPLAALQNLLFSQDSYNEARFHSPALLAQLVELMLTESIDVVQIEGTYVVWYAYGLLAAFWRRGIFNMPYILVLRAHNVEYTIWDMLASRAGNPLKKWYLQKMARRLQALEQNMLHRVDAVAAITEEDANRLRGMFYRGLPAPVNADAVRALNKGGEGRPIFAVIPAGLDLRAFQPDPAARPQPRTVFMIGSLNWLPNLEGLEWLLREVWPAVHAELPDLELHVAGSHPPAHLTARLQGQDKVFVHGFVDSAAAFMRQYDLMLVPLLSGGGMRIKIIEGMAAGKAILSTALGAEGVAVRDGHDLLVRDGAAAWQQALRDYYHGRLPVAVLGAQAAQTAAATYANARVTQRFEALYAQALAAGRA
jgi:glycosyltransferase involved in cell wall biosynthesis